MKKAALTCGAIGAFVSFGCASTPKVNRDAIREEIRSHSAEVLKCYATALEKEPKLEGKVVLRLTVAPTGTVGEVENLPAKSDLKNDGMMKCLLATAKTWSFKKALFSDVEVV